MAKRSNSLLIGLVAFLLVTGSYSQVDIQEEPAQTAPSLIDTDSDLRSYHIVKDKEFFDFVSQPSEDGYFVFFGAAWCGHCKSFKPTFVKLAKLSADKTMTLNPEMILYEVIDRDPITTLFKVNAFPTMLFIKNGRYCPFGGPRDTDTIAEFFTRDMNREHCFDFPLNYPSWLEQFWNMLEDFMVQIQYEYKFYRREFPTATLIFVGVFVICLLITTIGLIACIKDCCCSRKAKHHSQGPQSVRESKSNQPQEGKQFETPRQSKHQEHPHTVPNPARESKREEVPHTEPARDAKMAGHQDESSSNVKKRSKRD